MILLSHLEDGFAISIQKSLISLYIFPLIKYIFEIENKKQIPFMEAPDISKFTNLLKVENFLTWWLNHVLIYYISNLVCGHKHYCILYSRGSKYSKISYLMINWAS